ncbi:response regulator [Microbacterium sp. No. 7]|uniref:response regulator n=1 Tax=Microbacterium sp. No. 7 TaxID=1714373 RepID=UPI0006D29EB9|nr:response regulator [Microbacterium sp. No. 7]ALJ19991.1 hypothetical protein AOA12_08750 [Microbacterium sp. No. 7]
MSGIRTLVVDDDAAAAQLHARYVAGTDGFVVVGTAGTGARALHRVAAGDVELVLLDVNLPDFSGVEVLHRLRTVLSARVDVLVISSARDATTVRQALSAQVVGYLVKPFTREALTRRLDEYRAQRAERPPEVPVPLGQGDIDAIVAARRADAIPSAARAPAPASLPKGLSASTLQVVLDALDPVTAVTVREISERSGASAPTVRRYLDHLGRTGQLTVSHRFGARGRPEVLYRRAL